MIIPADWLKAHGGGEDKAKAVKEWNRLMKGKLRVDIARAYHEWKVGRQQVLDKVASAGWSDENDLCTGRIVSTAGCIDDRVPM